VKILDRIGVSLGHIRSQTQAQLLPGDGHLRQDILLTPRTKYVVDLAVTEARRLNNTYVGTEHLLLGLIREGEGLAGRILKSVEVDLERMRQEVAAFQAERVAADGDPEKGPEPGTNGSSLD
jgi:ATP-dependent Clp protease ATP-binding subunit ClpC